MLTKTIFLLQNLWKMLKNIYSSLMKLKTYFKMVQNIENYFLSKIEMNLELLQCYSQFTMIPL